MAAVILDRFQSYPKEQQSTKNETLRRLSKDLREIETKQENLTGILTDGTDDKLEQSILLQKVKKLEIQKEALQQRLRQEQASMETDMPDKRTPEKYFRKAQEPFRSRRLEEQQELINLYVERIIVHANQVEVILNLISFLVAE